MLTLALLLQVVTIFCMAVAAGASASSREAHMIALSQWAAEEGIVMHEHLQWKAYDKESSDTNTDTSSGDLGLELKAPVPKGTILLQVPRALVLDAN